MADPTSTRHRRPLFVMTAYCDGSGVWVFRLRSLRDGREHTLRDVQELLHVLDAVAGELRADRKETHAQA